MEMILATTFFVISCGIPYTCGDDTLLRHREIFFVGFLIHVVMTPYFISEKYFLWDSLYMW